MPVIHNLNADYPRVNEIQSQIDANRRGDPEQRKDAASQINSDYFPPLEKIWSVTALAGRKKQLNQVAARAAVQHPQTRSRHE